MTQRQLARMVNVTPTYVSVLESGRRRPSVIVLTRMAEALNQDKLDLFALTEPSMVRAIVKERSPWRDFERNEQLKNLYKISPAEMNFLSHVNKMGRVKSSRDFIFVLLALRYVIRRR
jgi:transcriptional regulator with XRE-family HTH domain